MGSWYFGTHSGAFGGILAPVSLLAGSFSAMTFSRRNSLPALLALWLSTGGARVWVSWMARAISRRFSCPFAFESFLAACRLSISLLAGRRLQALLAWGDSTGG